MFLQSIRFTCCCMDDKRFHNFVRSVYKGMQVSHSGFHTDKEDTLFFYCILVFLFAAYIRLQSQPLGDHFPLCDIETINDLSFLFAYVLRAHHFLSPSHEG